MNEFGPLWLTLKLASVTTIILLLVSTPLAWWLSQTRSALKVPIEALTALPLILPPTVLGFYLLILLGPQGAVGSWWLSVGGDSLTFSFSGLVLASCLYSLPFVVQPLQAAFESLDRSLVESAHVLGAKSLDTFFHIIMPLSSRGFVMATVLGFAHTVGEFGVVLMVGGNIPGETKVISIAIYDHVEALDYALAHRLSLLLLFFSFTTLLLVYGYRRRRSVT